MRKTGAAIVLFLGVTLVTGAAYATTLSVTDGFITLWPLDHMARIAGDALSVSMTGPWGYYPQPDTTGLTARMILGAVSHGDAVVGGSSCHFDIGDFPGCGALMLTSPATAAPPPGWPVSQQFLSPAVPFTLTGHLDVGSGGDLVGRGHVDTLYCFADDTGLCANGAVGSFGWPVYRYTIAVTEPSSIWLVLTGLVVMAGLLVFRARQVASGRRGV